MASFRTPCILDTPVEDADTPGAILRIPAGFRPTGLPRTPSRSGAIGSAESAIHRRDSPKARSGERLQESVHDLNEEKSTGAAERVDWKASPGGSISHEGFRMRNFLAGSAWHPTVSTEFR